MNGAKSCARNSAPSHVNGKHPATEPARAAHEQRVDPFCSKAFSPKTTGPRCSPRRPPRAYPAALAARTAYAEVKLDMTTRLTIRTTGQAIGP